MQNRKRCGRGRPRCLRNVSEVPEVDYFKPRGIPLSELETVNLTVEELEAIRLVDFMGLEHEEAAEKMNVSRKPLWTDLKSGRKKVADALINGKAIEIKGGNFVVGKD
jgi:hypothetical protein